MDDMAAGEDIPYRADDGYLEWWYAHFAARDGSVCLIISMGGIQQDDVPVEVAREAVRFWAEKLG
jgi:hypothetical protein